MKQDSEKVKTKIFVVHDVGHLTVSEAAQQCMISTSTSFGFSSKKILEYFSFEIF